VASRVRKRGRHPILLALATGIAFGVASVGAWAVAGTFQSAPTTSSEDGSSRFMGIASGDIKGADLLSSYPEQARADFDKVNVALARTTGFADIYLGTGNDFDVCLIVSYSEGANAATCVPETLAADRGLLVIGRDYPGDPIEIVAAVPIDTIAAFLEKLVVVDSLVAQRVDTTSMVFRLETERGTTTIDYNPADINQAEVENQ